MEFAWNYHSQGIATCVVKLFVNWLKSKLYNIVIKASEIDAFFVQKFLFWNGNTY